MIRSLKRALQPAVTDVSVEFKIPKSSNFEVQQSPHTLPPVYKNEKMVVYGIISPKSTPKDHEVSGTAFLKGLILGKPITHSVSFVFNPASKELPSTLPTIHHLAAKALIKDWERENASKEQIVQLSIDSSVVSSHTAFVAVDEEAVEPVTGAMKTWDVKASELYTEGSPNIQHLRLQVDSVQSVMAANIDKVLARGNALDDLGEKAENLSTNSAMFQSQAKSLKKKSGFSFGSFFSGFLGSRSARRSPPSRKIASDSPMDEDGMIGGDLDSNSCSLCSSDDESEAIEEKEEEEPMELSEEKKRSPPSPLARKAKLATESDTLSALIAMQLAGGCWKLDARLLKHFGKSQKEIEDACPAECKGDVATLWATVLVLTLLCKKYASQQDEWELVGMKAESWLKKQTIPSGVTLQDFYTAAEKL